LTKVMWRVLFEDNWNLRPFIGLKAKLDFYQIKMILAYREIGALFSTIVDAGPSFVRLSGGTL